MARVLKNMGIVLGLLVTVLILVNIFVIMPRLTGKSVQLAGIPEESPEMLEPDDVVIVDALAGIRDVNRGERSIHAGTDNENIRNPFFWPEEMKEQVDTVEAGAPAETEQPETPKPQLSMVIVGKERSQALIDDVFVREGDLFHGYRVKRIAANEVILSDDLGDISIFLTTAGEESGQDMPPGGVVEK